MLKTRCPPDLASQHTLIPVGILEALHEVTFTTGDVLLCLTPFPDSWKPQAALRSPKMCAVSVIIAVQSLPTLQSSCSQHFCGSWRFGCWWNQAVSLWLGLYTASAALLPVTPRSCKLTVAQTHFSKSNSNKEIAQICKHE